jgi:hypothetical protein
MVAIPQAPGAKRVSSLKRLAGGALFVGLPVLFLFLGILIDSSATRNLTFGMCMGGSAIGFVSGLVADIWARRTTASYKLTNATGGMQLKFPGHHHESFSAFRAAFDLYQEAVRSGRSDLLQPPSSTLLEGETGESWADRGNSGWDEAAKK